VSHATDSKHCTSEARALCMQCGIIALIISPPRMRRAGLLGSFSSCCQHNVPRMRKRISSACAHGATEIAGQDIVGPVWQGWTMTDDLRTGVIWLVTDVVDQ